MGATTSLPRISSRVDPLQDGEENLFSRFQEIRRISEEICKPLEIEDYGVQSIPEVSPPKWHLAHTTWFFETFVLIPHQKIYKAFHPQFHYLFNSYYKGLGPHHPRQERGLLSRPTVDEVFRYRQAVNRAMEEILRDVPERSRSEIESTTTLGLHHEQQHQELLLMDIKHVLYSNPLRPVYQARVHSPPHPNPSSLRSRYDGVGLPPGERAEDWISFEGGLKEIGFGGEGFSFDNERPRHRVFLEDFQLASRPVTNGEYLEFMEAGGYGNPLLWLSDGWDTVQAQGWEAPLYWEKTDGDLRLFTLSGMQPLNLEEPVSHVSYYEADAFARWRGKRLPTEAEWEWAADSVSIEGNFMESKRLHPGPSPSSKATAHPLQLFGDVWEWTQSPYLAYPRFRPLQGTFAEYNGKFMCNQFVLRGGCCFTPPTHIRKTYRNFYPPHTRWQCSGIRLAEDL